MEIVINVIKRFIKGANKNNISVYAAGSAFYWILSIVPIVIVISNIIAFTGLTEEILLEALIQFFPARAQKKLSVLVHFIYNNSMHMLPVAIFFAIWSAGRGMLAIMRGLNEINDMFYDSLVMKEVAVTSEFNVNDCQYKNVLIDIKGIFDREEAESIGFSYWRL